jgi:hypothetical protein
MPGCIQLGYSVPGDQEIQEPCPPSWRSLKIETVKYGHDFRWTQTEERLLRRVPVKTVNHRVNQYSERAPHVKKL